MRTVEFEKRPFIEMIIILVLTLACSLILPELKGIFTILLIVYFLVERRVRKRTRESIGLNPTRIISGLKNSWLLILFVSVVLQLLYFFLYKNFFPEVLEHVLERASFVEMYSAKMILGIIVFALGEEIVFRGLFQKRLSWVIKPVYAILLTSIIFALMHLSSGEPSIVLIDLTTVFIDSLIYGIIFHKTNNVYVSWIGHTTANLVAFLISTL